MISFTNLAPLARTLITALCFIAFMSGVTLFIGAYRKPFRLLKWFLPIFTVLNGAVTVLFATSLRCDRMNKPESPIAERFCDLPIIFTAVLIAITLVYYIFIIRKEIIFRKTTITRSAIKEGIDKVSSGLCFYHKSGRIILANNRMNELCHNIVGRDLQNASLFWEILNDGNLQEDVTKLQDNENPTFRLNDGSVWTFYCEDLGDIMQLVASEITTLQMATDELKEKNDQLSAFNLRLKKYGENVDELTRAKERLEIKSRIHRELGQALLASRRYLLNETDNQNPPIERWQQIIALLRKEAEPQENESPMAMLNRAAKATGVRLEITGELPQDNDVQKMFVQAAAEALTNAIAHANAKTLYVHFLHDVYDYIGQFTNDGAQPTENIVEGGGLSSLRRKIEREGGMMMVDSVPEFTLTVTLPMKGSDAV